MNKDIPAWKEITSYEGWASFEPDKKNRIREKWLTDIKISDKAITDVEIGQLRDSIYAEEVQAPKPIQPTGIRPPGLQPASTHAPGLQQPDILQGKQWDYNTDTRHGVVRDDESAAWRSAGRDELSLMEDSISRIRRPEISPTGEVDALPDEGSPGLGEALGSAARFAAERKLDPLLHPLKTMSRLAAPASIVFGGWKESLETLKGKDRGVMETIGDSFTAGYDAFSKNIVEGEVTDYSSVWKAATGKTLEERYGLLWGTLANIAGSCAGDPLVVGGLPKTIVGKLSKVAKGAGNADDAVNILGKFSSKLSPKMQSTIKKAKDALGSLKKEMSADTKKVTEIAKQVLFEESAFKKPTTKVIQKPAVQPPTRLTPATKVAPKTEVIVKPKASVKPVAQGTIEEQVKKVADDELIDTVEKFVVSGGRIKKLAPVETRQRTIVGTETVKRARAKAASDTGLDVEVLRGDINAGDVLGDFTRKSSDGPYLGSVLGGGMKYFVELAERARGLRPSPKQADQWVKKGILSIEKQWEKISPEVGMSIKLMNSRADAVQEQGVDVLRKIAKIGKTGWRGLAKPGDKKKFIKADLTDIALSRDNKTYFNKLSPDIKKRIKPAIKVIDDFFETSKAEYKARGVDINFKDRVISDMMDYNAEIYRLLKAIKKGTRTRVGMKELRKLGVDADALDKVKPTDTKTISKILGRTFANNASIGKRVDKLEYVHIPHSLWFRKDTGIKGGNMLKALKVANAHKRKTLSIGDLIESGAIKKEDVNIFDIVASYANKKSKDFALLDVKKAAVQAGLASKKKVHGFEKMDGRRAPLFSDVYLHPAFKKYMYDFQNETFHQNIVDKAFTMTKLWQFTRPAFLGYYNLQQTAVLRGHGLLNVIGTGSDYGKAIKQMATHNKEYYEILNAGTLSKPFSVPWNQFSDQVSRMSTTTIADNLKLFYKQNWSLIKPVYETLWNTAWVLGDEVHRLATFNYLTRTRGKVMSALEKGQGTALAHSDYANVPMRTRRFLQKPLFTGTFKITMGKLYKEEVKAIYKVGTKTLTGNYKNLKPKDKLLAKAGINTVLGIMGAMDVTMTKAMGYERDQFARRYYKLVKDDEGKIKENVVVYASPLTLMPRYAQKAFAVAANEGYESNIFNTLYRQFKYELHPIWRIAGNLASNKKDNGEPICNPWVDSYPLQSAKRALYGVTQAIKILDDVAMPKDTSQEEAKKLFKREVGSIFNALTSPMRFNYLRTPEHERLRMKLDRLSTSCTRERNRMVREGTFNEETARHMGNVLLRKQERLVVEIEKAEADFEKQVMELGLDKGREKSRIVKAKRGGKSHIRRVQRGDKSSRIVRRREKGALGPPE